MSAALGSSRPVPPLVERRRPGRPEQVHPVLVPLLLRGEQAITEQHVSAALPAAHEDEPDNMATARGIIAAIGISAGFWVALLAASGWWL